MTQFIIYKDVAGPNNKLPLCNRITTTMTMFVRLTVALIMEGNLILWELGVTWPAVCCSWNLEVSASPFSPTCYHMHSISGLLIHLLCFICVNI